MMLLNKALYKLYYTHINYILYYYSVFKIKNCSFKIKTKFINKGGR